MNSIPQQLASYGAYTHVTGASSEQSAPDCAAPLDALLMHQRLLLQAAMMFGMPQILCDELAAEIDQLCQRASF